MKDFSKYISRIKNSLKELEENSNLVKKARYNKKIIEDLEVEIKLSKQRKLETLELINQTLQDIEKLIDKQNIKD